MKSSKNSTSFNVRNLKLATQGAKNNAWAASHMGVLATIKVRFAKQKPLKNITVGMALHVTKETANLVETLRAGGATVAIAGCNPLSTQDDAAAYLAKIGAQVFAWKGQTTSEYYSNIKQVINVLAEAKGTLATIDDGLDLVTQIHQKHPKLIARIKVGTEETTTGVIRLRAMAKDEALKYPVIAVNDNQTKHLFDNYYGTGQSTIDGILRATSILLAGKRFIVVGYGHCGKGVAARAKGMGALVGVVEVNPVRTLQARMDGFDVYDMDEAAKVGDVFVTVTGNKHAIDLARIQKMKDGAILANSGHFDWEIDVAGMRKSAKNIEQVRPFLERFDFGGKSVYLCAEGRLVNLAAAEGHPSEVMDMSFAGQALAVEYGIKNDLAPGLHRLPESIDRHIADLKLKSLGLKTQQLTPDQKRYLASWREGT